MISEPLKSRPDPSIEAWLDRQIVDLMFLTATTLAEVLAGIAVLPRGRKRSMLASGMDTIIRNLVGTRVLPFDAAAARAYGSIIERTRAAGRPISVLDGHIAAVAMVHDFAVVTRDTAPFASAGLRVIDPWQRPET